MTFRFDWHGFLVRHGVPFVTSGPNTSRGNISIKCPWCGSADPSEHLGLSLEVTNPVWGCLRNSRHRGRSPVRLVAKLLRVRYNIAVSLVEQDAPLVDDFDAAIERLRGVGEEPLKSKYKPKVVYPDSFRHLLDGVYGKRFITYLESRGFHNAQDVAEQYELFYCLVGDFAWRLIFPVTTDDGLLVGWTGRDIRDGAKLRYRASDDLGKNELLTFDDLNDVVVVVEGPLDALKVDYYGRSFGISSVATMGTAVTVGQKRLLSDISKKTPTYILFDSGAEAQSLVLAEEVGAKWLPLPPGIGDPGEMDQKMVTKFLRNIVK